MGGEKREIGFCFQGDWTKRQPWRGGFCTYCDPCSFSYSHGEF
jgi:hypothetical protein